MIWQSRLLLKTKPLPCKKGVEPQLIEEAIRLLHRGGLIAFPTETYYGLGVDPFNLRALQRLFQVKQRVADKAVLLLLSDRSQVDRLASTIPADFNILMDGFWPGPLTLVFPAQPSLPALLTGDTGTVGLRLSPDPVAVQLVRGFGGPITATSANLSGDHPATTAAQVREIFGDEIDIILDGGKTPGGSGSTLVGFDQEVFCIRPGQISFKHIQAAVQNITAGS